MKAKVLGGYSFKSKNGNLCYSLTVEDTREDAKGTCCKNLMAVKLPSSLDDMLNKTYLIDTNGSFASDFYLLK